MINDCFVVYAAKKSPPRELTRIINDAQGNCKIAMPIIIIAV